MLSPTSLLLGVHIRVSCPLSFDLSAGKAPSSPLPSDGLEQLRADAAAIDAKNMASGGSKKNYSTLFEASQVSLLCCRSGLLEE